MELFFTLFAKLIPLYLIIILGYIAGRQLKVSKEGIARLLIYIIAPLVVFNGVVTTPLNSQTLSLPILFFVIARIFCLFWYFLGSKIWNDPTKNVLAFAAGTGNTGYFGLPVGIALFGPEAWGLIVLSTLGFILYENSLGFYITARSSHVGKEALYKLLKLPTIYAFLIGLIVQLAHIPLGQIYTDIAQSFRGAYTILGMMLIGLGIASLDKFEWDGKFNILILIAKFIMWPLVIAGLIYADIKWFSFYNRDIYNIMLLMAIVPLAANTVAFATELKAHPGKAAIAVVLSTIIALIYIPLMAVFFN